MGRDRAARTTARDAARRVFGARLRSLREAHGLSLAEVGKAVQTSGQNVSDWETGKGEPNESDVLVLAALYDMPPAEIRYGPQTPTGPLELYEAGRRDMGEWIGELIRVAIDGPKDRTRPKPIKPDHPGTTGQPEAPVSSIENETQKGRRRAQNGR